MRSTASEWLASPRPRYAIRTSASKTTTATRGAVVEVAARVDGCVEDPGELLHQILGTEKLQVPRGQRLGLRLPAGACCQRAAHKAPRGSRSLGLPHAPDLEWSDPRRWTTSSVASRRARSARGRSRRRALTWRYMVAPQG